MDKFKRGARTPDYLEPFVITDISITICAYVANRDLEWRWSLFEAQSALRIGPFFLWGFFSRSNQRFSSKPTRNAQSLIRFHASFNARPSMSEISGRTYENVKIGKKTE